MRIGNESGAGLTRRELLQTASAVIAGAVLSPSPAGAADSPVRRMTTGWEHYRGQLGGVWEVWRGKAASEGTSTGSRQVELYNGRAMIRARLKKGQAAVSVSAEKLPTALLTIKG